MNTSVMTRQEKLLYHQIYPAKLLADWIPGMGTIYLMWRHQLVATLVITFGLAFLATFLVIQAVDLKPYRDSRFGRYLKKYMSPFWQGVRFSGQVMIWIGAWDHRWWLMGLGLFVIIFGWAHGLIFPQKSSS
jgi:hypothetical protein